MPLFLAVPVIAKRHPKLGRLLLCGTGIANTALGVLVSLDKPRVSRFSSSHALCSPPRPFVRQSDPTGSCYRAQYSGVISALPSMKVRNCSCTRLASTLHFID